MSALAGQSQEAAQQYAEVGRDWPNDPNANAARLEVAAILSDWKGAFALLDAGPIQITPSLVPPTRSCLQAIATPGPALRAKARTDLLGVAAQPGGFQVALSCLSRMGFVDDAFKLAQSYQPSATTNGLASGELFSPQTANLRRDPRFMQLASRIGLTRYWRDTGVWPDFCAEPGLPYDCKAEAARLAAGHG